MPLGYTGRTSVGFPAASLKTLFDEENANNLELINDLARAVEELLWVVSLAVTNN